MRLSGFATGMDINQMVQDLMRAERMPMDRMKQDQQIIEWRMEEYRAINLKLDKFRTNIFDSVLRRSLMTAQKATSSNTQLVTATATSNANAGTFRITEVERLATAASNASAERISSGEKIDATKAMQTQSFQDEGFWQQGVVHKKELTVATQTSTMNVEGGIVDPANAIVKVNGVAFDVVTSTTGELEGNQVRVNEDGTLQFGRDLRAKDKVDVTFFSDDATEVFELEDGKLTKTLGKRGLHEVQVSVDGTALTVVTDPNAELTEGQVFVNYQTGAMRFAEGTEGEVSVTYKQNYTTSSLTTFNEAGNAVKDTFVFTGDQTLNEVVRQMNASKTGVNVFYDEHADKISIIRTETGNFTTGGEMVFSGGFFENGLKLNAENERGGQNAKFTINGLETERRSNTFTMNGVTMTLQGTFEAGTNTITIGASTDADAIMERIKGFVDEYNELVEMVNGKLREDFHRDFRPLTDDQRDAMSDREIERWEEKAMSGMLRNDRILRSGFDRFRMDMYTPVNVGFESNYNHLSAIGITTSSNFRDGGKLEINEDKLREAILNDADAVFQIFAGDGSTNGDKGVARRVRESANGLIDQISQRAGGMRGRNINHQFTLGRELNNLDDRISNFERRMVKVEQRYWSQFNAMEKAVAQSNAQAEMFFAQMFGGQF
ncbi:flagellar filament capping protein FliD [Evansella sp. AB-P1]|uniref:flagellar filament capping protein FliD n=1 Tax=Evansella sp. AB-P1 TaxID=3037653 RepID=UPI00241C35E5|nr:flagellar filament capping protein FliD [Evansella sp. AB-P1]MDG5786662.1 flagellar filament capping protein FliD [Evansella sp. AB-P1]